MSRVVVFVDGSDRTVWRLRDLEFEEKMMTGEWKSILMLLGILMVTTGFHLTPHRMGVTNTLKTREAPQMVIY